MLVSIPQIQSALNFFMNSILIYYRLSKTFELCRIFEGITSNH